MAGTPVAAIAANAFSGITSQSPPIARLPSIGPEIFRNCTDLTGPRVFVAESACSFLIAGRSFL